METEGVEVSFSDDGIQALAKIAAEVNHSVENIGARRLYTVLERVFEELSFTAPDKSGSKVKVDVAFNLSMAHLHLTLLMSQMGRVHVDL